MARTGEWGPLADAAGLGRGSCRTMHTVRMHAIT